MLAPCSLAETGPLPMAGMSAATFIKKYLLSGAACADQYEGIGDTIVQWIRPPAVPHCA